MVGIQQLVFLSLKLKNTIRHLALSVIKFSLSTEARFPNPRDRLVLTYAKHAQRAMRLTSTDPREIK